jgi:hypothetical protein
MYYFGMSCRGTVQVLHGGRRRHVRVFSARESARMSLRTDRGLLLEHPVAWRESVSQSVPSQSLTPTSPPSLCTPRWSPPLATCARSHVSLSKVFRRMHSKLDWLTQRGLHLGRTGMRDLATPGRCLGTYIALAMRQRATGRRRHEVSMRVCWR